MLFFLTLLKVTFSPSDKKVKDETHKNTKIRSLFAIESVHGWIFPQSRLCIEIYIKRDNKVSDLVENNFLRFSRHSPGFIFVFGNCSNGCYLAIFIAPSGMARLRSLVSVYEFIALLRKSPFLFV